MRQQDLVELVVRFTDTFNSDKPDALDTMLEFFAENATYDQYNGKRREGRAQIRTTFEPQFKGTFGKVRFEIEDVFADADAGKSVIRWCCTITKGTKTTAFRGLDILQVNGGGKITHKLTYAKTDTPLEEA